MSRLIRVRIINFKFCSFIRGHLNVATVATLEAQNVATVAMFDAQNVSTPKNCK